MIIVNQVYISQRFLLLTALLHDAVVRVLSSGTFLPGDVYQLTFW